jgi:hypothetical protein
MLEVLVSVLLFPYTLTSAPAWLLFIYSYTFGTAAYGQPNLSEETHTCDA